MHLSETEPGRDTVDEPEAEPELEPGEERELEPGEDGQELEPVDEAGSDDRLDPHVREQISEEAAAGDEPSSPAEAEPEAEPAQTAE